MSTNPNTVKSQDDINEEELGRTMTLLRVIEQLDKTVCKLEKVEKQLDIAVKALKKYAQKEEYIITQFEYTSMIEYKAFNDGGITAQKALDDIEELNK
ncbi:MAG: hypothetical protein J6Z11_17275 [Candidatus Riflebacteria bacterium]|nr:hypothetical protein [Candidatus Riflebacteria bacterium]